MEEMLFLELTTKRPPGMHWVSEGTPVLVCLPFDLAERRGEHTYVLTKAGAGLYVKESLPEIKAMIAALADHVAQGRNHQHTVVRRPDGTDGSCCQ